MADVAVVRKRIKSEIEKAGRTDIGKSIEKSIDPGGELGKAVEVEPLDPLHDQVERSFILAQLDPLRALPVLRVPGTGREPDLSERQLHARRRVQEGLQALGGHGSPTGSWAWHVLGCQSSIREWAMRQGWGGRSLHVQQSQGIALAALDLLARHFGYRADTAA